MALLHLFLQWQRAFGKTGKLEILAGHVHHGIRGEEADRDAAFVAQEAQVLGVKLLRGAVKVRTEARRRKLSLESAARELRYEVLGQWACEHEIHAVAVAHHLDDQAETVILRAARGTGLRGLAGMPVARPLSDGARVRLIRPLLKWRRSELVTFLHEIGGSCLVDSTNQDPTIPRNLVRHTIIPLLESGAHPGAVEALARLAEHARRASEDLALLGMRALREALVSEDNGSCVLSVEKLRIWPRSVLHEVLKLVVAKLHGPHLGFRVSREVQQWILSEPTILESSCNLGRCLDSSSFLGLELRYGFLRAERIPGSSPVPLPGTELELPVPGSTEWGGWEIRAVETSKAETLPLDVGTIRERVDAALVQSRGRLTVRSRRLGERFRPLGAPGAMKLKEFFREARVRPVARDRVPVVDSGGEIVWVVGHRIADGFRVTERTDRVLVLDATRKHEGGG